LKSSDPVAHRLRYYDAHNHLQDPRLVNEIESLVVRCRELGIARMVVNGTRESDWLEVQRLSRRFPEVYPSFGCHPWYSDICRDGWEQRLREILSETPGGLGEIGLDRWILRRGSVPASGDPKPSTLAKQEVILGKQLAIAIEGNLPASIHCLDAWGRLFELIRTQGTPARGFLLHSYGGPQEMVKPLCRLGAFFSFSGYFLGDRQRRRRQTFKEVPLDRLLIETDAPDQPLPDPENTPSEFISLLHPVPPHPRNRSSDQHPQINPPTSLPQIYTACAQFLEVPLPELIDQVEANFHQFFGR